MTLRYRVLINVYFKLRLQTTSFSSGLSVTVHGITDIAANTDIMIDVFGIRFVV